MNTGIGFTGVLTLIFIVLKLTHVVSWSWWWVLSPTLISTGLALLLVLIPFIIAGIAWIGESITGRVHK